MLFFIDLLLIILVALPLVQFLAPGTNVWEKIALGYFVGFGIVTYGVFLSHIWFSVPITFGLYALIMAVLFLIGIWLNRTQLLKNFQTFKVEALRKKFLASVSNVNWFKYAVIILVFLPPLLSVFIDSYWPIRDWDAITLYDFRAKVVYITHNFQPLIEQYSNYYFAYPMFTSLSNAYFYFFGYANPMAFYGANFLFFAIIFYSRLRSKLGFVAAAFFTALISYTFPIFSHSLIAYANLPYTTFLVAGYLYLFTWVTEGKSNWFWIGCLLLGISIWNRDAEPFWVSALLLVAIQSYRLKNFKFIGYFIANVVFFMAPWAWYKGLVVPDTTSTHALSLTHSILTLTSKHLVNMVVYLFRYFVEPYMLMHAIFIISLIIFIQNRNYKAWPVLVVIVSNYLIVLAGTGYLSLTYSKWLNVGGSLERMVLFFIPLSIFFAAQVLHTRPRKK